MTKNNKKLAPIAVFCYNRVEELKQTISALEKCDLASDSELYIFSDGQKEEKDNTSVEAVRKYAQTISNFKNVFIESSPLNKGLADSIIQGVSKVLKKHENIIVLEDDLITSKNFLQYMNQSLQFFSDNDKVISISGFTTQLKIPVNYEYDNYFTKRASSWGWATWKNRWQIVDWSVSSYDSFYKSKTARKEFNKMGSDMSKMLKKQMTGKINSWAIRWCYHQYKNDLFTVFPVVSKISNIGFTDKATNTKGFQNRYSTTLDISEKSEFKFKNNLELDTRFIRQFISTFSIPTRAYYKLKSLLGV